MLGLYRETLNLQDLQKIQKLKELESEIKKNHPFLSFMWWVRFTAEGTPSVKLQILGIESYFLLPDAVEKFKGLAGSK